MYTTGLLQISGTFQCTHATPLTSKITGRLGVLTIHNSAIRFIFAEDIGFRTSCPTVTHTTPTTMLGGYNAIYEFGFMLTW